MAFKNLFIFGAGILFGVVAISLVSAYYMFNSVRNYNLPKEVQFEELEDNRVQWNPPTSFRDALETWYTVLLWHISGSKCKTVYRNDRRARIIFISALLTLLIVIGVAIWFSFDIQAVDKLHSAHVAFCQKVKNLYRQA
jgi:hypothetical protein